MRTPVLIVLIALALSACLPASDQPLTPAGEATADTRLLGTWLWRGEREVGYLHIATGDTPGQLKIVEVSQTPDKGAEKDQEYLAHASRTASGDYLNLRVGDAPSAAGYLLVRYRFDATGALEFALMSASPVKQAIQQGALAGSVTKKEGWASEVRITATPEALRAFIDGRQADLFDEYLRMEAFHPYADAAHKDAGRAQDEGDARKK